MRLSTDVERIAIDKITVGVRRRQKLGNLRSLAKSIEAHGLLHPILIRGHELIVGQRRLEACRRLNWSTIPARRVDGLTDEQLRDIELDESTERRALLDYESSRARLAEIRQAEADARADLRGDSPRNSRGRPSEPGSRRDVAARTGVAPAAQRAPRVRTAATWTLRSPSTQFLSDAGGGDRVNLHSRA